MVNPNWGIMQPLDIGGAINQGYEAGRQRGAENALSAYAQNPNDENALMRLAKFDPRQAMQVRQQQAQAQKAAQKEERDEMLILGKLLDGARDEASYQRGLGVAKQYGIDVQGAPPSFDPEWVDSQKMLVRAFSENKNELPLVAQELQQAGLQPGTPEFAAEMRRVLTSKYSTVKTIPYNPGGGVAAYDEVTRQVTPLVIPNTGEGSGPKPGDTEDGYTFKGGNPADPANWVQGGGVGNGTGGF